MRGDLRRKEKHRIGRLPYHKVRIRSDEVDREATSRGRSQSTITARTSRGDVARADRDLKGSDAVRLPI